MVWTTAVALAAMLLMTATLLVVVMVNGLGVFWPSAVEEAGAGRRYEVPRRPPGGPDQSA